MFARAGLEGAALSQSETSRAGEGQEHGTRCRQRSAPGGDQAARNLRRGAGCQAKGNNTHRKTKAGRGEEAGKEERLRRGRESIWVANRETGKAVPDAS